MWTESLYIKKTKRDANLTLKKKYKCLLYRLQACCTLYNCAFFLHFIHRSSLCLHSARHKEIYYVVALKCFQNTIFRISKFSVLWNRTRNKKWNIINKYFVYWCNRKTLFSWKFYILTSMNMIRSVEWIMKIFELIFYYYKTDRIKDKYKYFQYDWHQDVIKYIFIHLFE